MLESIARHYNNSFEWDYNTLYLYFFLLIASYILGLLSQYAKPLFINDGLILSRNNKARKEYSYFLFILLLLVSGLRMVGTDYLVYKDIYDYSTTKYSGDYSIEPGYLLLNKIIFLMRIPFEGAIFIFSFFTIYFVFRSIKYYSGGIAISLAFMAYVALYYLPGFNMMRMYLAASITLFSYNYLITGQIRKFFILFSSAVFIHYSAMFFILPAVGVLVFNKNKKVFWALFFIGWFLAFRIASIFSELTLIDRWVHYAEGIESENSSGLLHWITNVPLIALYIYASKKIPENRHLSSLIVFSVCELLIGLLSYKITILGRSLVYYNTLFIIIIPVIIRDLEIKHTRWNKIIKWSFIVYLFFRFNLYLSEYLYLDGIMPYKMIDL